jgi:hypothetical protein
MFWVLQQNLFSEQAFQSLLEQLERQDVPHEIVKLVPFIHEMTPDVNPEGNVYVCGSTGIGKVAKKKGWVPGYFDDNLDYELVMKNYGEDCLNWRGKVTTLRNASRELLRNPEASFFARPCSDTKSFSGTVFDWAEFDEWRNKVVGLEEEENSLTTLQPDDRIVLAPLTKIYSETRFYVVDGEVVTGSLYKFGNTVQYSSDVMPFVRDYAREMVKKWQPNRAFVLDIADTDEGPKVIEINAINSSGFYACDMGKYIDAINSMKF